MSNIACPLCGSHAAGRLVENAQRDVPEKAFKDMVIPVFYDPLEPSNNVALCATCLRLRDSDQR